MSTALIRDIRNALADFGRPVPDDVTLTTGVRELIAALSESEDDRIRIRVERNTLRAATASLRADLDLALTQRTTLIATANRRLYNAKFVAFFAGIAVATIVEAVIRMAQ